MNSLHEDLIHVGQNSWAGWPHPLAAGTSMNGRDFHGSFISHGYQNFSYVRSASTSGRLLIRLLSHLEKLEELGTPQEP